MVKVGVLLLVVAGGCSEPLRKNAQQPPPALVTGLALAAAVAGVMANPGGELPETWSVEAPPPEAGRPRGPQLVEETVTADIFDRLDRPPASDAGVASPAAVAATDAAVATTPGDRTLDLRVRSR